MAATPNAIDVLVGGNIRFWRLQKDMTSLYVAKSLGLSAAALGSMEAGATRIGAADLQRLCALLGIRPAEVYEDRGLLSAR